MRFWKMPLNFQTAKTFRGNKSKRFVSLEIEVAFAERGQASTLNNTLRGLLCSVVHDGSIGEGGFEINTQPANGDLLYENLDKIARALVAANAAVDNRCGVHVHVDARDFQWYDVRRPLKLWDIISEELYKMIPAQRRRSRYCQRNIFNLSHPVTREENKKLIWNILYDGRAADTYRQKFDKYAQSRYAGFNLHSWQFRGTFEYRIPPGTIDSAELKSWAQLFLEFTNFSYKVGERAIGELKNENAKERLEKVFSPVIFEFIKAQQAICEIGTAVTVASTTRARPFDPYGLPRSVAQRQSTPAPLLETFQQQANDYWDESCECDNCVEMQEYRRRESEESSF